MVKVLTVIVIIFLIFFLIKGWRKGFFRILLTTMSLIVTIVAAAALVTPVTQYLQENTKIGQKFEEKVEIQLFGSDEDRASEDKDGNGENKTSDNSNVNETATENSLKDKTDSADKESSEASDNGIDNFWKSITGSENKTSSEEAESADEKNTSSESTEKSSDSKDTNDDDSVSEDSDVINDTKLPNILKKALISKNTAAEYVKLGVSNFKDYVVKSVANILLKIFVYIALVIVIYIIIRILLMVSKVITKIPIIHGINKLFGAALGLFQGLLIIWLIGFVISLISNTGLGTSIVNTIHESSFLTFLYDNNSLLKMIKTVITFF